MSVLLFFVVDSTRISTGSSGNKAEQLPQLVFMLLMSCPIVAFFVYFLFFQTYVYVLLPPLCQPCTANSLRG